MNKKKISAFCLAAVAAIFCTACGCAKKDTDSTPTQAPSSTAFAPVSPDAANSAAPTAETGVSGEKTPAPTAVPPSSNKEVVTEKSAPKDVYWLVNDTNNLTYHLANCVHLKGKDALKINWSFVKTLALRQCPECNPPQYEGYVETK